MAHPTRIRFDNDGDLSALIWDGEIDEICLMLHGLGDCAWIWRPVIEHWYAPRPTFIALDLPGHGHSAARSLKASKSTAIAENLVPVLSDLAAPVWIVGHSAGAKVATRLVRNGSVPACGLGLVDAAIAPSPAARGRVMAHVAMLRRGAGSLERLIVMASESDPLADTRLLSRYFEAAAQEGGAGWHVPVGRGAEALLASDMHLQEELSQITLPVQVIRGAFSSICTAGTAAQLVQAAPRARPAVLIERAGHAISMEQPGALSKALATAMNETRHGETSKR